MSDWTPAWIGLGANLGDAPATLAAALKALMARDDARAWRVSGLWRSAPVEARGPDFFNAVAGCETRLDPEALLDLLQAIEQVHGRERPYWHAPRTLDLDLLLHGQALLQGSRLTLPHPRLHLRAFVLRPLLELAPALQAPGLGLLQDHLGATAGQALERVADWPGWATAPGLPAAAGGAGVSSAVSSSVSPEDAAPTMPKGVPTGTGPDAQGPAPDGRGGR